MQIPVFERFPWLFWVLMAVVVVVVLLVLFAIRSRRRLWKAALGLSIWLILSCSCAGFGVANVYATLYYAPPANVPAPVPDSSSLSFLETTSDSTGLVRRLMTLDARTGAARWQRVISRQTGILPGVDERAFYVVGGPPATISAVRRSDGQELWRTPLRSPTQPEQPLISFASPIVSDGVVYVMAEDDHSGILIIALHAESGALAWTFPIKLDDVHQLGPQTQMIAAGQGMLFVESPSKEVIALRSDDGTRAWSAPANPDEALGGPPVFADGKLYIIYGLASSVDAGSGSFVTYQRLVALDARDGKRIWSHLAQGYTSSGPISVGARSLYYQSTVTGDHGLRQYLNQISAQTGELQWQYEVINPSANIGAVEAGDLVYFASSIYLDALRVSDGHRVWRHRFQPNTGFGVPVVVDGVLYVKSYIVYPHVIVWRPFGPSEPEAAINALNASTGVLYWRSAAEGVESFAPPWLTPGSR